MNKREYSFKMADCQKTNEILTKYLEKSVQKLNKNLIGKIESIIVDTVDFDENKNKHLAKGRSHTGRLVMCEVGERGKKFIGNMILFVIFGKYFDQ